MPDIFVHFMVSWYHMSPVDSQTNVRTIDGGSHCPYSPACEIMLKIRRRVVVHIVYVRRVGCSVLLASSCGDDIVARLPRHAFSDACITSDWQQIWPQSPLSTAFISPIANCGGTHLAAGHDRFRQCIVGVFVCRA